MMSLLALCGVVSACVGGDLVVFSRWEYGIVNECIIRPSGLSESIPVLNSSINKHGRGTGLQSIDLFRPEKVVVKDMARAESRTDDPQIKSLPTSVEWRHNGVVHEYPARSDCQFIGRCLPCVADLDSDVRAPIRGADACCASYKNVSTQLGACSCVLSARNYCQKSGYHCKEGSGNCGDLVFISSDEIAEDRYWVGVRTIGSIIGCCGVLAWLWCASGGSWR